MLPATVHAPRPQAAPTAGTGLPAPSRPWGTRGQVALVAAAFAAALLPMLAGWPVPALLDYPNHLARMSVLARDGTAAAHPHYVVAWSPMPNLAMDLIVPWLGRRMGIEAVGFAFLLLSQALVVAGAALLDLAAKGRVAWAPFAAIGLLPASPFAWGFLNFEFGTGLALVGIAGWVALSRRAARPANQPAKATLLLWHALLCLVLCASHLLSLGFYGWTIGLVELSRWRRDASGRRRDASERRQDASGRRDRVLVLAILAAPPALLLGAASLVHAVAVGAPVTVWLLRTKAAFLLAANGFSQPVSIAVTCAVLVGGYRLWRSGEARLVGAGGTIAAGFALLFLAMPATLLDTNLVDVRVPVMAALVLPAFIELRPAGPARLRTLRLAAAVLLSVSVGTAALHQLSFAPTFRALEAAFDHLPAGSRLLPAYDDETADLPRRMWDYPVHHAATLAVIRADAFVPTLFTHRGKQPVRPAAETEHLEAPEGGPVPLSVLLAGLDRPGPARGGTDDFARNWLRDFDHLCLWTMSGAPLPERLAARLTAVATGPRFTLYRIVRPE